VLRNEYGVCGTGYEVA